MLTAKFTVKINQFQDFDNLMLALLIYVEDSLKSRTLDHSLPKHYTGHRSLPAVHTVKHNVLEAGFDSASGNSSILKPILFDQQYSVKMSHLIQ